MIRTIKLGLAIVWPAFWTGVPLKIVLMLLFLAAGVHPWQLPALAFFLLLSIPIDIWALSLSARTVFLERLRLEPPEGLGVALWWQIALLTAVYGPLAYVVETQTISVAQSLAAGFVELMKGLPVAERIGIELVLWGSIATIVLLVLVLIWLYAVGWIVQRHARMAPPLQTPYPVTVQRVDLMRIPADQALMLTVFLASGAFLVLLLWAFMPVTTPHPHEEYKKATDTAKASKLLKPAEVIQRTETVIAQAEASIKALEEKAKNQGKDKGKPASGKNDENKAAPKPESKPAAAPGRTPQKSEAHDSTPHSH
jgi:hypothetical protein